MNVLIRDYQFLCLITEISEENANYAIINMHQIPELYHEVLHQSSINKSTKNLEAKKHFLIFQIQFIFVEYAIPYRFYIAINNEIIPDKYHEISLFNL